MHIASDESSVWPACSYRLRQQSAPDQMHCELVAQILGFRNRHHSPVTVDICRRCVAAGQPSAQSLNPVVASLIYAQGAQAQCESLSAAELARIWQGQQYALPALHESLNAWPTPETTAVSKRAGVRPAHTTQENFLPADGRTNSPRIGLIGENTQTGLGTVHRGLASHLPVTEWLVTPRGERPAAGTDSTLCSVRESRLMSRTELERWVAQWDWIVFAERPPIAGLVEIAHHAGVRTALIPMWEWTSPIAPWLRQIDLLICPTQFAYQMFREWRHRFGFRWSVEQLPWPVDEAGIEFRVRQKCELFLMINGLGGASAPSIRGTERFARKGLDIVREIAWRAPRLQWLIRSQCSAVGKWPPNVTFLPAEQQRQSLYAAGDVCVQFSRWEGIGLPLLECQFAGLPLITTDVPPMNEYRPWVAVPAIRHHMASVTEAQPILIPEVDVRETALLLESLRGRDLTLASQSAHDFVRARHSWRAARQELLRILGFSAGAIHVA